MEMMEKVREHVPIVWWRYDDTKDARKHVSHPRKQVILHAKLTELIGPKDIVVMSWKLSNMFKP